MEDLEKKKEAFAELLEVIATLRVECPWDRKQTMESLRALSIEEVYELGDAILTGDMAEVKKELGDLLMHIVFYAQIGSEKGAFDITDVLNSICEKLKYRHPHIYGGVKVDSAEEVLQNWEQLKLKEKGRKHRVLEGVPVSLPALVKAYRIQDKARGAGFDWKQKEEVWTKVKEELQAVPLLEKVFLLLMGCSRNSGIFCFRSSMQPAYTVLIPRMHWKRQTGNLSAVSVMWKIKRKRQGKIYRI